MNCVKKFSGKLDGQTAEIVLSEHSLLVGKNLKIQYSTIKERAFRKEGGSLYYVEVKGGKREYRIEVDGGTEEFEEAVEKFVKVDVIEFAGKYYGKDVLMRFGSDVLRVEFVMTGELVETFKGKIGEDVLVETEFKMYDSWFSRKIGKVEVKTWYGEIDDNILREEEEGASTGYRVKVGGQSEKWVIVDRPDKFEEFIVNKIDEAQGEEEGEEEGEMIENTIVGPKRGSWEIPFAAVKVFRRSKKSFDFELKKKESYRFEGINRPDKFEKTVTKFLKVGQLAGVSRKPTKKIEKLAVVKIPKKFAGKFPGGEKVTIQVTKDGVLIEFLPVKGRKDSKPIEYSHTKVKKFLRETNLKGSNLNLFCVELKDERSYRFEISDADEFEKAVGEFVRVEQPVSVKSLKMKKKEDSSRYDFEVSDSDDIGGLEDLGDLDDPVELLQDDFDIGEMLFMEADLSALKIDPVVLGSDALKDSTGDNTAVRKKDSTKHDATKKLELEKEKNKETDSKERNPVKHLKKKEDVSPKKEKARIAKIRKKMMKEQISKFYANVLLLRKRSIVLEDCRKSIFVHARDTAFHECIETQLVKNIVDVPRKNVPCEVVVPSVKKKMIDGESKKKKKKRKEDPLDLNELDEPSCTDIPSERDLLSKKKATKKNSTIVSSKTDLVSSDSSFPKGKKDEFAAKKESREKIDDEWVDEFDDFGFLDDIDISGALDQDLSLSLDLAKENVKKNLVDLSGVAAKEEKSVNEEQKSSEEEKRKTDVDDLIGDFHDYDFVGMEVTHSFPTKKGKVMEERIKERAKDAKKEEATDSRNDVFDLGLRSSLEKLEKRKVTEPHQREMPSGTKKEEKTGSSEIVHTSEEKKEDYPGKYLGNVVTLQLTPRGILIIPDKSADQNLKKLPMGDPIATFHGTVDEEKSTIEMFDNHFVIKNASNTTSYEYDAVVALEREEQDSYDGSERDLVSFPVELEDSGSVISRQVWRLDNPEDVENIFVPKVLELGEGERGEGEEGDDGFGFLSKFDEKSLDPKKPKDEKAKTKKPKDRKDGMDLSLEISFSEVREFYNEKNVLLGSPRKFFLITMKNKQTYRFEVTARPNEFKKTVEEFITKEKTVLAELSKNVDADPVKKKTKGKEKKKEPEERPEDEKKRKRRKKKKELEGKKPKVKKRKRRKKKKELEGKKPKPKVKKGNKRKKKGKGKRKNRKKKRRPVSDFPSVVVQSVQDQTDPMDNFDDDLDLGLDLDLDFPGLQDLVEESSDIDISAQTEASKKISKDDTRDFDLALDDGNLDELDFDGQFMEDIDLDRSIDMEVANPRGTQKDLPGVVGDLSSGKSILSLQEKAKLEENDQTLERDRQNMSLEEEEEGEKRTSEIILDLEEKLGIHEQFPDLKLHPTTSKQVDKQTPQGDERKDVKPVEDGKIRGMSKDIVQELEGMMGIHEDSPEVELLQTTPKEVPKGIVTADKTQGLTKKNVLGSTTKPVLAKSLKIERSLREDEESGSSEEEGEIIAVVSKSTIPVQVDPTTFKKEVGKEKVLETKNDSEGDLYDVDDELSEEDERIHHFILKDSKRLQENGKKKTEVRNLLKEINALDLKKEWSGSIRHPLPSKSLEEKEFDEQLLDDGVEFRDGDFEQTLSELSAEIERARNQKESSMQDNDSFVSLEMKDAEFELGDVIDNKDIALEEDLSNEHLIKGMNPKEGKSVNEERKSSEEETDVDDDFSDFEDDEFVGMEASHSFPAKKEKISTKSMENELLGDFDDTSDLIIGDEEKHKVDNTKEEEDNFSFGSFDSFRDDIRLEPTNSKNDGFDLGLRSTLETLERRKVTESNQNWNIASLQTSKEEKKMKEEFGADRDENRDTSMNSKDDTLDTTSPLFLENPSVDKSDGILSLKMSSDEHDLREKSKKEVGEDLSLDWNLDDESYDWDLDDDAFEETRAKTPEDAKKEKKVHAKKTATKSLPKKNRKKVQKKKGMKGISKKELRRRNKQRFKYFFGWFVEEFADTEIRMKNKSIKCFKSFLIGSRVRLDRVIKLDKSLQIDQVVFLKLLSGYAEASLIPKKDLFDYYCLFDFLKMPECMYLICKEVEKVGSTKLLIYLFVKCRGQFETHLNFIRRDYSVESLLEEERPARKDKVKFHSAFSLAVYTMLKAREMQIRRSNELVTYFVKLELLFLLELNFERQPIEFYFKSSFTKSFKELFRRNLLVLMKKPRKYGNFAVSSADNITFRDRHLEVLILKSNFFFDIVEKGKISPEKSGKNKKKKKKKRSANPLFHLGKVVLESSSSIKLTKSSDSFYSPNSFYSPFIQHLKKMRAVQLQLQCSDCVSAYLEYIYSGRITRKTGLSGLCELKNLIKLHGGEKKLLNIVDKRLAAKMNSFSKSDAATTIYDEVMRTMKILFHLE